MEADVIVVGGGHAGIEAAHVAAKRGVRVLLITSHLDLMAQMSCNPSVGGIAKGTIVREVDALGGIMGRLIDRAGIHFRMLNRSKGPAVWGNRAQADKAQYRKLAVTMLRGMENVALLQGMVTEVRARRGRFHHVVLDSGEEVRGRCVVLAMGTFLNGLSHIGMHSFPCGRTGEPPSKGLTESLHALGVPHGRLKTGTSPRLDGKSIDFDVLARQEGDEKPWPFSYGTTTPLSNRVCCWEAKTTARTHELIRGNLDRSPLYAGKITSIGPRYCPSIEDKVVRFGDRNGHTLFLEPEGSDGAEIYLSGLSTSLPFDVQVKMVNSIRGLEHARIIRPGYGIEYDFFPPVHLRPTLESRHVPGVFFAGQINGTSGYEEAACQGLIAGLNAAEQILEGEYLVPARDSSYIGVLIDDLVTKGTEEPYRMFTSRAEYRLLLRQDNADERLMTRAFRRGLVDRELYDRRRRAWQEKARWIEMLGSEVILPDAWNARGSRSHLGRSVKAKDLLRRPDVAIEEIEKILDVRIGSEQMTLAVEADIKYEGFIEKQKQQVRRARKMEHMGIPEDLDFVTVHGLLAESRTKLSTVRPSTVGQASRIPGITPADINVLIRHIASTSPEHVSRETRGL